MSENYSELRGRLQGLAKQLGSSQPGTLGAFAKLHHATLESGALATKTKELIAIGIAITSHCKGCLSYHVKDALKAGATAGEIEEAIGVAILMGGGPAVIYGCEAFEALQEFNK